MDHATLFSDSHFSFLCSARAFLLSGGFSLAFGSLFIKTYRVYHIFVRSRAGIVRSKLLHDQQLLGMVSVLLLIDFLLIILWVNIDQMERKLVSLFTQVSDDDRNIMYLYLREQCSSTHMVKWLGTLYIYKGFLLGIGSYMAWVTRGVKVPALNDSHHIGMSVYNVVITSVIVVTLSNIIPAERYTLTYVVVSILIFLSTTATLCILFVPKIVTVLTNPDVETVVATPGVTVECRTRRFPIDESSESIFRAEVHNRTLHKDLKQLEDKYYKIAVEAGIGPDKNAMVNEDGENNGGLPARIMDDKEFSASRTDGIWCTRKPTIASAFGAIHNVALQIPSTSKKRQLEIVCEVELEPKYLKEISCTTLRASMTTIKIPEEIEMKHSLSDRTLNKSKTLQISKESYFIASSNLLQRPLEKQMKSEPTLYCDELRQNDSKESLNFAISLNQISLGNSSQSDCNWTTAPLNESTSFSTALEDFMSSSNNNNSSSSKSETKSLETNGISHYTSCEDASLSPHEFTDFQSSPRGSLCLSQDPDNSTFCEFSSRGSYASDISSSSSIGVATISDISTQNIDCQKGSDIHTDNADTLLNEFFLNPTTVQTSDCRWSSAIKQQDPDNSNEEENACFTNINNIDSEVALSTEKNMNKTSANGNGTLSASGTGVIANNEGSIYPGGITNENDHLTGHSTVVDNLEQMRQMFELKREMILSQLDQSESVDL
ncbi:gamma-aminobutyric acid type B receptor subunit 2 [Caerostris darwini]|uniref:Gamma-aminobutyric acid type B receptor subunit 2 n=1 Tax=Caerostris darwini TaxID=1538125 RepID=A0AAV4PRV0_9ARAC|nr:gamma-aminobutyric acid type B receptor subunit 2 [Caerostris darwini]